MKMKGEESEGGSKTIRKQASMESQRIHRFLSNNALRIVKVLEIASLFFKHLFINSLIHLLGFHFMSLSIYIKNTRRAFFVHRE